MSIQNIIFDLGGVVFNWKSHKLIERLFENEEIKNGIKKHLLQHPDWIELDRGTLSKETAILRTQKRSGLDIEVIDQFLSAVPESLTPKDDTFEIIDQLIKQQRKLYVLSNMHFEFARYLESEHNIWDSFIDIVYSCDVLMVKPNRDIYELILKRNSLKAEETLFIDDTQVNLDMAESLGIKTHLFTTAERLKEELISLSLLHNA